MTLGGCVHLFYLFHGFVLVLRFVPPSKTCLGNCAVTVRFINAVANMWRSKIEFACKGRYLILGKVEKVSILGTNMLNCLKRDQHEHYLLLYLHIKHAARTSTDYLCLA